MMIRERYSYGTRGLYPLMDLVGSQLEFFSVVWVKVINSKYPFVE